MQTYKNLTDHEFTIPNIGVIPPQGTINTEFEINNPNLQLITNQTPAMQQPQPTPAPQPVQANPAPVTEGEH